MRKIKIIKLDTDNKEDIEKFKELWLKLNPDVEEVFISKNVEFKGKESK